jgi:PTS system nitrogen regulatory IIA component
MKNDFTKFVLPESIITLSDTKKLDVMDKLIDLAADLSKLDRDTIFRLIWKREQMMTTAVGGKLALPHIRINDILNPLVLVGICKNPIEDYKSQDDSQVQVIVFTVAPDENQEAYLQLLSSISRRFRNPEFIENLIDNAGQNSVIYDMIVNPEA